MRSGAIPTSYSRLELLQYFNMSHNQLSGHLPSFLSSNADLAVADMTSNNFHGGLPVVGLPAPRPLALE